MFRVEGGRLVYPDRKPVAFSYRRFSDPRQRFGRSEDRQDEGAAQWARLKGVPLDDSLKVDKGLSAYTGANLLLGALGDFCRWVERGKVKPGDYLVVEHLDRLSRQQEDEAMWTLLGILRQGVVIVQLMPEVIEYRKGCGMRDLMNLLMQVSSNHQDSKKKSERIGERRAKDRQRMREGVHVRQRHPSWLRWEGDGWVEIPERAAVVRRIARAFIGGQGATVIARRLNEDRVPTFGIGRAWRAAWINQLMRDGRVAGYHQPRGPGGAADGAPIGGYYPSILDEATWEAVRRAARSRQAHGGRTGHWCNVFSGRLTDALVGRPYVATCSSNGRGEPMSLRVEGVRGLQGERVAHLPYFAFERAVFSRLTELDKGALAATDGAGELAALDGQLHALEERAAAIAADLADAYSPTLARAARQVDEALGEVKARRAALEERFATDRGEALDHCQALIARLADASDPAAERVQIRAAFRLVVASAHVVGVRRGLYRCIALQLRFHNDRTREYLIVHRRAPGGAARAGSAPMMAVASWPMRPGERGAIDLRDKQDARWVRDRLETIPLDSLPYCPAP